MSLSDKFKKLKKEETEELEAPETPTPKIQKTDKKTSPVKNIAKQKIVPKTLEKSIFIDVSGVKVKERIIEANTIYNPTIIKIMNVYEDLTGKSAKRKKGTNKVSILEEIKKISDILINYEKTKKS